MRLLPNSEFAVVLHLAIMPANARVSTTFLSHFEA